MKKNTKFIVGILIFAIILFIGITTVNAAVEVTRNVYSNNGSMKFEFTGLTLDTTKEYEFALTNTTAETPEKWFDITEYTATNATVDITMGTKELRNAFNKSDKGYITLREKTSNNVVVEPYQVDLKLPYLLVTDFTVINNGKEFDSFNPINVALRNADVSTPYYQYEKITDENVINKYKEIKANNGNYLELQSLIKTATPTSNWITWKFWNGLDGNGMNGRGYTEGTINVPDTGLYYMWLYFSGENIKPLYGVVLVDNLVPDIELESISIDKTRTVELDQTLTLTPTFNPSNSTNKIVTWTSSDESVAIVSNAGVVTPIKVGATIITVTSQDGNKKATCTVTVTEASNGTSGGLNTSGSTNTVNGGNTSGTSSTGSTSTNGSSNSSNKSTSDSNSKTTSKLSKLPYTGIGITGTFAVIVVTGLAVISYRKYNNLKGIK